MNRHEVVEWAKVEAKLKANAEKLFSINFTDLPTALWH